MIFETSYKKGTLRYSHVRIKANTFDEAESLLERLKQSKFWQSKVDVNTWKIEGELNCQIPCPQKKSFEYYEKQFKKKRLRIENRPQSSSETLKPEEDHFFDIIFS